VEGLEALLAIRDNILHLHVVYNGPKATNGFTQTGAIHAKMLQSMRQKKKNHKWCHNRLAGKST